MCLSEFKGAKKKAKVNSLMPNTISQWNLWYFDAIDYYNANDEILKNKRNQSKHRAITQTSFTMEMRKAKTGEKKKK